MEIIHTTEQRSRRNDGRKTTNAALIPLLRAGVIASIMILVLGAGMAAGATWVVDDSGGTGVDYTTIQAAVDAAIAGDVIEVRSGVYDENVGVDKRVTLIGDGADVVKVRAASSDYNVFEVTADYVSISGFTATWAGYCRAGIYLNGADHCNIYENIASDNYYYGIYLEDSSNNTLTNNIANSNNYYGILLSGSNNLLVSNTMSGNACNFDVYGSHDIDASNTVDGKPIYYWVDQKDRQIPSDAGFVGVVNGTNITVRDLTLTNNSHGVLFAYTENSRIENVTASNNYDGIYLRHSSNNTLTSNTASNNYDGIYLWYSSDNTLASNTANSNNCTGIHLTDSSDNTLASNTADSNNNNGISLYDSSDNTLLGNTADSNDRYGIWLSGGSSSNTLTGNTANSNNNNGIYLFVSSSNTLTGNTANSNNNDGIYLRASWYNILYHNNLAGNADHNACDTGTNQWDSGSEGNYYSDYTGTDSDGDGIGNTTYPIPGDRGVDRFPLMQPWTGDTSQKGDLNFDGEVTSADAVIALQIAVGSRQCNAELLAAADVSGDGSVTSLDVLMILQAAVGNI